MPVAATENGPSLGRVLLEDFTDVARYANFAAFAAAFAAGTTPWDKDAYALHASAAFATVRGVRTLVFADLNGAALAAFLDAPLTKVWLRLVFGAKDVPGLQGADAGIIPYGPPAAPHVTYPTTTGLDGQQIMQFRATDVDTGKWITNHPSYGDDEETALDAAAVTALAAGLIDTRALLEATVVEGLITDVRIRTYLGDTLVHDVTEDMSASEWTSLMQAIEVAIKSDGADEAGIARVEVYDATVNADPWSGEEVEEADPEVLAAITATIRRADNGQIQLEQPVLENAPEELAAAVAICARRAACGQVSYAPPALVEYLADNA